MIFPKSSHTWGLLSKAMYPDAQTPNPSRSIYDLEKPSHINDVDEPSPPNPNPIPNKGNKV